MQTFIIDCQSPRPDHCPQQVPQIAICVVEERPFPVLHILTDPDIDLYVCVLELGVRDGEGATFRGSGDSALGMEEGGDCGNCRGWGGEGGAGQQADVAVGEFGGGRGGRGDVGVQSSESGGQVGNEGCVESW